MAEFYICRLCGKIIVDPTDAVFVKVKGVRELRWYCKECVKGGGKRDAAGKGHRAEAHQDR